MGDRPVTNASVVESGPLGAEGPDPYPLRLLDQDGAIVTGPSREDVASRLRDDKFFWLDLPRVGDEEIGLLRDLFELHPLALDDARKFGERPKLDDYDGYTIIVLFGTAVAGEIPVPSQGGGTETSASADGAAGPVAVADLESVSEVHCVVSEKYLLTIHRGTCPALRDYARRAAAHKMPIDHPARLVYRIADTLVDSFFPVLGELDDRIDALQGAVIAKPDNEQLGELLRYRSALISMRRVVTPQRDLFASLASGVSELPGFDDDDNRYLRDIYDHLIRLSDLIDGYRDLLSGTTDAYLSVVSNQLNVVMKQLSIIATIFLPLSFLTGFFGQNFSWLVGNLTGVGRFVILGLGTELVAVVVLVVFFRKRGWLAKN